jgi:hypothetical protein
MRYYCLDGFLKKTLKNAWYFGKFCLYLCIDKKVKNMTALEIIEKVERLNQEQYEIVVEYDRLNSTNLVWTYLNDIGPHYETGEIPWLNINVYSEIEKDEYDFRRELGF